MDLYFFYVSTLAADEKYIRRATVLSEQKKKIHLNFILAVKKLIEMIFNKMDQKEIKNKMKKLLYDEKQIISKAWLLEIVDDL